jgi:aryl-alcohol dehydrogenase-like predicted oxidoreductase
VPARADPAGTLPTEGRRTAPPARDLVQQGDRLWPISGSRVHSFRVFRRPCHAGVGLIDTADFYGLGHNESLIAHALAGIDRDRYLISDKFGGLRDPSGAFIGTDCRPATLKNFLGYSLQRLGSDHVDIYRPARLDPHVPVEETVGAIAEMVHAGYVRWIGLSEVGAETIRRAHAVHPISDVQIEYSLFTRKPEDDIIPTCRELGIGITAYGVLSHGLLTGRLSADDVGAPPHLPRLHGQNRRVNIALADRLRPVADRLDASVAQLAIAWVLAQRTEHPDVVAIVGAGRPERIADNLAAARLELNENDLADIEQAIPRSAVAGERYAAPLMAMLDSER